MKALTLVSAFLLAVGLFSARDAAAQSPASPPLHGRARLPLTGFAPRPGQILVVDVVDAAGRRAATFGGTPDADGGLEWDTRVVPDGAYTLRLIVLDEASGAERAADTLAVVVANRSAPAARTVATAPRRQPPPRRAPASSRSAAAHLPARGSRTQQFHALAEMSRALGDPHPEIAAAQWALESGWGRSPSGAFNYFGIKATGAAQPGTNRETREWEGGGWVTVTARFADYGTPEEGVAARLAFLRKPRYAGYWAARTPREAARALQGAGYATDPRYAEKLADVLTRVGL